MGGSIPPYPTMFFYYLRGCARHGFRVEDYENYKRECEIEQECKMVRNRRTQLR